MISSRDLRRRGSDPRFLACAPTEFSIRLFYTECQKTSKLELIGANAEFR